MIVVTGGAGFIGSNLVRSFNQSGRADIIVVDDLRDGRKHLNLNRLSIADYFDRDEFLEVLPRLGAIEAIFHQGACTDTTVSDGRLMMQTNYHYSRALLHWALDHRIPFLYASSAAVYGTGADGFVELPSCEYPLNVYGYSKLLFDNYVRRLLDRNESQIVGLRYFNVYGPQENHKGRMASVCYQLYRQHAAGEAMKVFEGSDEFRRDFIYVDDVVAVNRYFFESGPSGIFNCGTGTARSFFDVARVLQQLTGGTIEYVPFPDDLVGKYQAFTEASLDRLRAAGYTRDFIPLEEGVTRYRQVLADSGGQYR